MHGRSQVAPWLVGFPLVALLSVVLGCGEGGTHVSGKVTFQGKPVPQGKVYILPDSSAGNSGAAGYADIKDGMYDTSAEGGHAATPGAVVLKVEGIDPTPPPNAEPDVTTTVLFTGYEKKIQLPAEASVQDIDVPAEAAKGPVSQPEGAGRVTP